MSKLGGGILTAVGVLIAGTSGLCSLAMFAMGMGFSWESFGIVGVVGGIPFLVGCIILYFGLRELKRARENDRGPLSF
jgi:ABC-type amino acid transport system permease subunit